MQMNGRVALVTGVANKRSIAWAIAERLARAGAQVVFTYQNERFEKSVKELALTLNDDPLVLECDVNDDGHIRRTMEAIQQRFGRLDALVHAIAFAPTDDLKRPVVETSREGYLLAHEVSAYSLAALTDAARPLMGEDGGSVLTLTYFGAEKVIPGYNVMGVAKAALETTVRYVASELGPDGIRVNAISAGPVSTLAARGVGVSRMMKHHAERAPLRRNITTEEIAETALFLLSDSGSGITGEVIHVDAGYHIMGM